MNKSIFYLLALLLVISSCRNSKDLGNIKVEKQTPKILIDALKNNYYDYTSFNARLKIRYKTPEKSQSFTANLRMIKDSVVWSNFTSLMGIEVGRILIRKDSVFVLDRMGKVYYERPYEFIEQYLPYKLSLEQLQNILLGQFDFDIDNKAKSKVKNKKHQLSFEESGLSVELQMYPRDFNLYKVFLEDQMDKRSVEFVFKDYATTDSIPFSTERNIQFEGDSPLESEIRFSRIEWNEPVNFPFFVGSRYEKK